MRVHAATVCAGACLTTPAGGTWSRGAWRKRRENKDDEEGQEDEDGGWGKQHETSKKGLGQEDIYQKGLKSRSRRDRKTASGTCDTRRQHESASATCDSSEDGHILQWGGQGPPLKGSRITPGLWTVK